MSRRKAVRNNDGESTTTKQHKQALNKCLNFVCDIKKMPHDFLKFVHDRGNMTDKANSLFCEFTQFLNAQPGITINTWKTAFNWLQHEVSNQVGACNKLRHVAHIRRLKLVEDESQKIKSSTSELEKQMKMVT